MVAGRLVQVKQVYIFSCPSCHGGQLEESAPMVSEVVAYCPMCGEKVLLEAPEQSRTSACIQAKKYLESVGFR